MATDGLRQAENWKNPERPPISPLLLTLRQAAKVLSISERTLFTLTKDGALPAVRVGKGGKRYRISDLERYTREAEPFIAGRA